MFQFYNSAITSRLLGLKKKAEFQLFKNANMHLFLIKSCQCPIIRFTPIIDNYINWMIINMSKNRKVVAILIKRSFFEKIDNSFSLKNAC